MELKDHIEEIAKILKQDPLPNEAEICGIIGHILTILKWPLDNSVRSIEYPLKSGLRVDFALRPFESESQVFIEVKKIGNIDGAEDQLFKYAAQENVPIAILTDGQKWQFFYPSGLGDYEKRKVDELDLEEEDSEQIAERFDRYLSYKAVREGEAAAYTQNKYEELVRQREIKRYLPRVWKNLVESRDGFLLELVAEATKELCGYSPSNEEVFAYLKTLAARSTPPDPPDLIGPTPPYPPYPGPTRLRVTMDGGTPIEEKDAVATFIKVIETFGIEDVLALELGTKKHRLVLRKNRGADTEEVRTPDASDCYSIYTGTSTKRKKKFLVEIAERLNRQLQVDIVPK